MLNFKPNHLYKRLYNTSSTSHTINYLNRRINLFLSHQVSDLKSLHQSHGYVITTGHTNNLFIASKLISLYASLYKPQSSTQVFDSVNLKDTFLWNSIIKAHFSNGDYSQSLQFYTSMRLSDNPPDQFTIPMVVSSFAELESPIYGVIAHGLVLKLGFFAGNSAIGSSFLYMYSKCGYMEDAYLVFDEMPVIDVIAWTALVIGYVQNGESEKGLNCLFEMHKIGGDENKPNCRTLEGGLQACGNLGSLLEGSCLHCFVIKTGIGCSHVIQSSILSMYSKCGAHDEAYLSFLEVSNKDLISWTSIIAIYARMGSVTKCLGLFFEMQVCGVYPDGIVISCVLLGFGNSMRVLEGKAFHGLILRRNLMVDNMVRHALLSMYCKFGLVALAERLFDRVHESESESWNIMVFGYGKRGEEAKCIDLFREMQYLGIESDLNSLVSVLSSCSQSGETNIGRGVHCYTIKNLMHENVSVANSLIHTYGKSGNLSIAWKIFCRTQRDSVTWNTLISSYTHNGYFKEALALFDKMISEGFEPTSATLVSVLSSCSHIASLERGEKVHSYIKDGGFDYNISIATALVDMYAKCGKLEKSREIFNSMREKDVVSWNVMISSYGVHGDAKAAIEIFQEMRISNVRPNELTFLAVLSACAHVGLVDEGKSLFGRMKDYSIMPTLKHYSCMVDLLGRTGNLHEAEALVLSMPIVPDGGLWGALLSACKIHNEGEMGIRVAKRAIESDPENDGYYIMLSNFCTSKERWEEAESVRILMKERGVRKKAGWSTL